MFYAIKPPPFRLAGGADESIEISAWPNPASGYVNFALANDDPYSADYRIFIFSISGSLIAEIPFEGNRTAQWPRGNVAGGIYVYQLLKDGIREGSGKLVLQ